MSRTRSVQRPITVLVCLSHFKLGGAALNAIDFAYATRDFGIKTVLIGTPHDLPTSGPSILDVAEERGVSVRFFEPASTTWKTATLLTRMAEEYDVDIVHTYAPLSARMAFWGPARFGRRPIVTTIYETAVAPQEFKGIPLIVGSEYMLEARHVRPGSVTLVSPPVDLRRDNPETVRYDDFLAEHHLEKDNLRLVIVSRLVQFDEVVRKSPGIEAAMRSLETLDRTDVDLVIAGTGPDEARLREVGNLINARLDRRAIVFTGPMADPRPAYASADVVIGMGNSAARGLAFAKPVVVVGDFGKPELVDIASAQSLFVRNFWNTDIAPDPSLALGAYLRPLLGDRATRASLGSFGRSFAAANFGLEAMAERLAGVYEASLREYGLGAWMRDVTRDVHRVPSKAVRLLTRQDGGADADNLVQRATEA